MEACAVLGSPLGQVKQTIEGFLVKIREAIESVPTEDVRRVVNEMLAKVQSAVAQVNVDAVQEQIEGVLAGAEEFVNTQLKRHRAPEIGMCSLAGSGNQLNSLPLANLLNDLNGVLGQMQNLISELANVLERAACRPQGSAGAG